MACTCKRKTQNGCNKKECVRVTLYNRQDGLCYFCFRLLSLDKGTKNYLTIDHVIPKSRGGKNCISNYVGACSACNNEKGNSMGYTPITHGYCYTTTIPPKTSCKVARTYSVLSSLPRSLIPFSQIPAYNIKTAQLTDTNFAYTMQSMPVRQTIVKL